MTRLCPAAVLAAALALPARAAEPPAVLDLCRDQTPIRAQGGRDTCPYFPPIAALEAAYGRAGEKVELSVEHLLWLRNVTAGGDKGDRGTAENLSCTVGGGNGMGVLKQFAVCRARDMPYHGEDLITRGGGKYARTFGMEGYSWDKACNQFVLNRWNFDPHQLPPAARAHARYAIDEFVTFPHEDLRDPRKFEEILAGGHEIVFALNLHANSDDSATGQPVWRLKPNAPGDSINHFMLMVGYDRPRHFFVVKNQWGPTNYSAMRRKLAAGWQDVVKYDGYTLVDYNYLAACAEAHYVTAVAPVGSPRFTAQRALGLWAVTVHRGDEAVMTGVLCWRRLPTALPEGKPDLRIGDLVTRDGQQFRVNARLDGDGVKSLFRATVYVDFATGVLPTDSTGGSAWRGTVSLPEAGTGTLELKSAGGAGQKLWGADPADLRITATLVPDRNLLRAMPAPK